MMPMITVLISLAFREVAFTWRLLVGLPLALVSALVIVSGGLNKLGQEIGFKKGYKAC